MAENKLNPAAAASSLRSGKIAVIPTDTIYGVAASALSKKAVARAYKILRRNPKKPFIVLASSLKELESFGVFPDAKTGKILKKIWPGKVSIVLPLGLKKYQYLHRGTKTLAFRIPKNKKLISLLKKTGPLISTSANPEGGKPAETVAQAKKYFGDTIDFYIDGGKIKSRPSTILKTEKGKIRIARRGAFQVPGYLLK